MTVGALQEALDALAGELRAAGIPTVTDPAIVSATVAERGSVAWVQPPESVHISGLNATRIVLLIPVSFIVHPWTVPNLSDVLDYLPAALVICRESATQTTVTIGDLTFPAYRVMATRTVIITS